MLCPNCREELEGDPRVCPHCGTDLRIAKSLLDNYSAQLQAGIHSLQIGDIPSAIEQLREAIELIEGIFDAHFYLGVALILNGQRDNGVLHLDRIPDGHSLFTEARAIIERIDSIKELRASLMLPDERDKEAAARRLRTLESEFDELSGLEQELELKMLASQSTELRRFSAVADRLTTIRFERAFRNDR
ncbi:MAG: hypothetical protein JW941_02865 [Candidatus Coatesbacteria bacterium]|nr:hypothetical protein [Candidatus Coatesbacteria bacterium]